MVTIITAVVATIILPTSAILPGYGASSSRISRHSQENGDAWDGTVGSTVLMFNVHESRRRLIRLLETVRLEDLARGLEQDIVPPDVPNSASFVHPGGRALNDQRHRDQG